MLVEQSKRRYFLLWACPLCDAYTTDSDAIECGCDVEEWDEIWVVEHEGAA